MKKYLFLCLLVLLSGCARISDIIHNDTSKAPVSKTEEETTKKTVVCTGDNEENITLEVKGDAIQSMKQVSFLTFDEMGISISDDMEKNKIQDSINQSLQDKYKDLKGVSVTGTLMDSKVEITTTINFKEANFDELVDAGLLSKGTKGNQVVSLKKTMKAYKADGYACKVSS